MINKPHSLIVAALNSKIHRDCIESSQFSNELNVKIMKYL